MAARTEDRNLGTDLHEVVSSWLTHKDPIPKGWKTKTSPINAMKYSELQILGMAGCSDLKTRAREAMHRLKSLSDTLNELSSAFQAEFEAARTNFEVVSNMCSLVYLPNELIARIFECVVNGDQTFTPPTRWEGAVKLSHVCQYFRNTALSCSQMWSNICGNSNMAALCLSRSNNVPLNVTLPIELTFTSFDPDVHNLVFDRIIEDTLPHAKRWRSLDVVFIHYPWGSLLFPVGSSGIRHSFQRLNVPALDSLHIKNGPDPRFSFKAYHEFEGWNAPGLRHVTSDYYFPLSLPGLVNVTSLDITLQLGQIDWSDILKDLSRMTALEDFRLTLYGDHFAVMTHPLEKTDLPSVRRLWIHVPKVHELHAASLMVTLFSSLFFSGATDLHYSMSGSIWKDYPEQSHIELSLIDEVMFIFQHIEQYPRVERFYLEANGINDNRPNTTAQAWLEMQQGSILLVVPFNMLPNMKHFTLCSNRRLLIQGENDSGASVSALETITLNIVETGAENVAIFIREILDRQKERGDWDSFRELVVVDNNQAEGQRISEAKATYPGQAAFGWCERRMFSTNTGLMD